MRKQARAPLSAAAACVAFVLASLAPASAQEIATANASQSPPSASPAANPPSANPPNRVTNADIMEVPLVNNIPGAVLLPAPANPMANDPQAAQRGMKYFEAMNCVGCHAPNGAGGMGPSLSDASRFKFGSEPARLFAVISHGAPLGMPAWGSVLPNDVIWDIVSYIESINKDPQGPWGHTFNLGANMPATEQTPAEFEQSVRPWNFLQEFSDGKKPSQHNPTAHNIAPSIAGAP